MIKRFLATLAIVTILISNLMPARAYAKELNPPDEKVVAKNGNWDIGSYISPEGQRRLYSMYIGDKELAGSTKPRPFQFRINRAVRPSRIHLEFIYAPINELGVIKNPSENDGTVMVREAEGAKGAVPETKSGEVMVREPSKDGDVFVSVDENNSDDMVRQAPGDGELFVSVDEGEPVAPIGINRLSDVGFALIDSHGVQYGPWKAIIEGGLRAAGDKPPKTISATVVIEDNYMLKKGLYTLKIMGSDAAVLNKETKYAPAVVVIGVDFDSWLKYWKANEAKKMKEAEERRKELGIVEYGQIMVSPDEKETGYKPPNTVEQEKMKPTIELKDAEVVFDKEYHIDEIQTDHFNGGKGAAPGKIMLVGEKDGKKINYGPWTSKGVELEGVKNGIWSVAPDIILPPGKYTLIDEGKDSLSYDIINEVPKFYIRVSEPPVYDFTGSYNINIKTACTFSMNPSKIGKPTAFDRDDFQIAIIDRGEAMEVIGRYTQEKKKDIYFGNNSTEYDFYNVPFSQLCPVINRKGNFATIEFKFDVDLTNLPYKAKVGTNVLINLDASGGPPVLKASGTAYYLRAYKEGYGGDNNQYAVAVNGYRGDSGLPPYVQEQIAKVGRAGNVPGPETPEQGAAGVLFPPLTALILQIALTMKKPKKINPEPEGDGDSGGSDGDSGDDSGSDGGDDSGDGDSGGDGESGDGSDSDYDSGDDGDSDYDSGDGSEEWGGDDNGSGNRDSDYDSGGSGGDNSNNTVNYDENNADQDTGSKECGDNLDGNGLNTDGQQKGNPSASDNSGQSQAEVPENVGQESNQPADGEEMTLKTKPDSFGRSHEYNIKYDAKSGEWINTENGNIVDMNQFDEYNRNVDANNKFNAEQIEKIKNRDTEFDRTMDEFVRQEKEREDLINALNKIQKDSYGIGTESDPNKVASKIDKLIKDLVDRDRSISDIRKDASKAVKVVGDFRTGAAISEDAVKRIHDQDTFINAVGTTLTEGMKDIVQGRTWAGMGGRMAIAIATGGASEIPMSVTEGMMNIKENIDKGDDGVTATIKAMGGYVVGEIAGEGASKVIGKLLQGPAKYITKNYGGTIKRAGEYLNKPVSEIIENSSAGKGMKQIMDSLGLSGSKEAGEGLGRGLKEAADRLEFNNYKRSAEQRVQNLAKKVENGEPISLEEVKSMLRDPRSMRQLKKSEEGVRTSFNDSLNGKLYEPTDNPTRDQLEKLGMGNKVEMDSIRTPGTKSDPSAINTDNDAFGTKKVTNYKGETVTKEIDRHIVGGLREENFAKAAGVIKKDGSFDIEKAASEMPDVDWKSMNRTQQMKKYSEMHNQEVTDVFSPEGSIDYSSNSTSIRRDGIMPEGVSNIQRIENGQGTLMDAEQLGKMDVYKVDKYLKHNDMANQCEGFEQLSKMGKMADRLTTAYQNNGYNVNSLSKEMKKAIEIAGDWNLSPLEKTAKLQQIGFKGPMDLADKLSGRIEGLKLARPMNPDGETKEISSVISKILMSRFNDNDR